MKNSGVILLIDRPLDHILSDIKFDRRPLLAKKGPQGVIDTYNARIDTYHSAADITFINDSSYYESISQLQRLITSKFQL